MHSENNIEAAIRHYIVSGYAEGRTDTTITATNNLTNDTNNSSQTTLNEVSLYLSDLEALNYIACNEDLITAFGTNINEAKDHYERYGSSKGRSRISGFNAANYLNNYSDLSNAFGDNIEAAIRHYIVSGYAEGRTDINISSANTKIQFEYLNFYLLIMIL